MIRRALFQEPEKECPTSSAVPPHSDDDDDADDDHGIHDVQVDETETVSDSDQSSDPSYIIIPTDDDQVSDKKDDRQMRRLPSSSITRTRESPPRRRRRQKKSPSRKTTPASSQQLLANTKEVEEKLSEGITVRLRLLPKTGKVGRPKKNYECNYCGMVFQDSYPAVSHIKKIHLNPKKPQASSPPCPICNHPSRCQPGSCSFQSGASPEDNSVLVHFVQIQPKMRGKGFKKMYKCKVCEKNFETGDKASRHVKNLHSKSAPDDADCPGPDKGRGKEEEEEEEEESTIPKHTRAPRNTTYRCDKCDFVTKVRGAYIQHIQNHSLTLHFQEVEVESEGGPSSAVVNVKYLCKLCGIRCSRNKRYAHLNQMHAEVIELQLLQCHICGKGFNNMQNVKVHLAWHAQQQQQQQQHSSLGEAGTIIVCEICGVSCASSSQLSSHRRRFHPEVVEKPAAAPQKMSCCKVCGFSCRGSVPLSEHMRESHGELYKFKCELCSKGFLQEYVVQVHKEKYHVKEMRRRE